MSVAATTRLGYFIEIPEIGAYLHVSKTMPAILGCTHMFIAVKFYPTPVQVR